MADRTGQQLGQYALQESLGTDRYGMLYRAVATAAAGEATVRIIAPPTSDDRWFADRVGSTLRRYIGISNPHLAPLLAVGEVDGAVYTVGPPLAGTPLRARLGAPLPPAEVAALLGPIAAALDAIHGRYLVHGDLRPESIILTANGPILTDAGLGAAIADATHLSAGITPTPLADEAIYRAPETFGSGRTDARADIYSFAVIVYEALAGHPPLRSATSGDPLGQDGDTSPAPPREQNPALSDAASGLIVRALATSPYGRPHTARELTMALGPAPASPATHSPAQVIEPAGAGSSARQQASPFAAPTPLAAPAWITPTADRPTPPASRPRSAGSPPVPHAQPAPKTTTRGTTGQQRPVPPAPNSTAPGDERTRNKSGGAFAAYAYVSPSDFDAIAVPDDTAQQLVAGRTRLVSTLAALARRRAVIPPTTERQHLANTLRAATASSTPKQTNRPQVTQELSPRMRQSAHRPTPTERAKRYVDNWREVYSVPPQEAIRALVRNGSTLIVGAIFAAMFFNDIRCFLLIALGGALGLLAHWRSTTERVIICNPDGFIVESGFFPQQRVGRFYRWSEVRATRYYERNSVTSRGNRSTIRVVGHFAVMTPSGEVFDQTNAYIGFDFSGLVARFGAETPHLPYLWVPGDRVDPGQAIERKGLYAMVARRQP